jgi:hypothetical protein
MHEIPRYEFRAWGPELGEPAQRISAAGRLLEVRDSREVYLAVRSTTSVNPKIRGNTLDVKALLDTTDGYEHWQPVRKWTFPVGAAHIADLCDVAGIDALCIADDAAYDRTAFLREVAARHEALEPVEVVKHRTISEIDDCLGEVADVTMFGRSFTTVAVESADLRALDSLCPRLGLDAHRNQSYPAAIRAILDRGRLDDHGY